MKMYLTAVLGFILLTTQCCLGSSDTPLPSVESSSLPTDSEVLAQVHALGAKGLSLPNNRDNDAPPAEPWIEPISAEPRAFLYHNFLHPAEAEHIMSLARPNMIKSKVIMGESGTVSQSSKWRAYAFVATDGPFRTSSGAWVKRGQDPIVAAIEQRIADWTGAPVENAEPMHVLKYQKDEQYTEHFDFYFDDINIINGGQRVATILMYLTDVEEGGETVFPLSVEKPTAEQSNNLSDCARQGIAVKPRKGDALLFFSVLPDGQAMDERSLHAGCPVIQGEKWVATKWLREEEWIDAPLSQINAVKQERELMKLQRA